jgi:hydrogenase nickel incorporation protein HypA/HybF
MRKIVSDNGYGEVYSVTLDIGQLEAVVPEALDFAFEALREGTEFANTTMIQNVIPARGRCRECGTEQRRETLYDPCVECGGFGFELLTGKGLVISQMEVDSDV